MDARREADGGRQLEEQLFILGSDSTLARDEFLRLLYGAQVSLEVGVGATLLSLFLGTILGAIAGFYRGWADTTISRLVELTMAFPYLLFVITLAATLGTRLNKVTLRLPRRGRLDARSSSSACSGGSTRRA